MEHTTKRFACKRCGRELVMGDDVTGVQQGVIGPRGFVALEDMELLCLDGCADDVTGKPSEPPYHLPRRIA